ncbi:hypothetical protein AA0118_g11199 [Alternaria tenuissima]|jgi:hypothetical protein|nr:hypothetical protein AA0118_g11199 [Alternaria tenuissima]
MDYHQNDQADAEALANSLERDYYLPQAYDNDSPQTYSGLLSNDGLTYEPEVQEQCISPLDVEGGIAFDDVVTDGLFHHIDFGRDSPSRSTLVNNNDPFTLDTITANQEQDDVIPSRHASSTRRSCRIQPSSLESADPLSPVEHTASHLSRPKRTKISLPERAMLDAYFRHTPYPSKGDIARLAKETKLANQVIETWFNNARTRKTAAEG